MWSWAASRHFYMQVFQKFGAQRRGIFLYNYNIWTFLLMGSKACEILTSGVSERKYWIVLLTVLAESGEHIFCLIKLPVEFPSCKCSARVSLFWVINVTKRCLKQEGQIYTCEVTVMPDSDPENTVSVSTFGGRSSVSGLVTPSLETSWWTLTFMCQRVAKSPDAE